MKKSKEFAKNGAWIFGLGNAFLNLMRQLDEMDKNPDLNFKWQELFVAAGKGAIVGGVAGFGIGAIKDHNNSLERPIDLNRYLVTLAESLMLDKSDPEFVGLNKSVKKIVVDFMKHFGTKINGELIPHGSTEKGTALHDSFDIDIAIPFHPRSFANNEVMYNEVLAFFEDRQGTLGITDIREQKRSIGVCVSVNGSDHWVDFAPYKLSKENSNSGYLFVNKRGFFVDNSTIQKTDLSKLKKVRFSDTQKKLIVLLKKWKLSYELPLPSHFLEYLVEDAYRANKGVVPRKIEQKMVMILKHIADRLHIFHIKGNENTNNIISNSIDDYDKQTVIDACNSAIKDYEYQPNSLTKVFDI